MGTNSNATPAEAAAILKAAPVTGIPSLDGASLTGIPSQKIVVGGLAGAISWLLLYLITKYVPDFPVPADVISAFVAAAFAYFTPPSQRDVVEHMTDENVQAAMRDKKTNVSYVQMPIKPPPDQPAVIVPPATKV